MEDSGRRKEAAAKRRLDIRMGAVMAAATTASLAGGSGGGTGGGIAMDPSSLMAVRSSLEGMTQAGMEAMPPGVALLAFQGSGNPDTPGAGAGATAGSRTVSGSSGTVFSTWAHLFFPAILNVLVPPPPPMTGLDGVDGIDGMDSPAPLAGPRGDVSGGGGGFHYVLRDLSMVLLTAWGGVFEKAPAGPSSSEPAQGGAGGGSSGRLSLRDPEVAPAASRLIHRLVISSPSAESNIRYCLMSSAFIDFLMYTLSGTSTW